MNSRERVLAALNHTQPDGVPVDFGGTAVTGIHVSSVAALRDYYGLEKRPVKVHEPYQMLGWLDEDLKQAMGIDVEGLFPWDTLFGFVNRNWKPWRLYSGLEVLAPEDFRTSPRLPAAGCPTAGTSSTPSFASRLWTRSA
jgi:hypothetical protein